MAPGVTARARARALETATTRVSVSVPPPLQAGVARKIEIEIGITSLETEGTHLVVRTCAETLTLRLPRTIEEEQEEDEEVATTLAFLHFHHAVAPVTLGVTTEATVGDAAMWRRHPQLGLRLLTLGQATRPGCTWATSATAQDRRRLSRLSASLVAWSTCSSLSIARHNDRVALGL